MKNRTNKHDPERNNYVFRMIYYKFIWLYFASVICCWSKNTNFNDWNLVFSVGWEKTPGLQRSSISKRNWKYNRLHPVRKVDKHMKSWQMLFQSKTEIMKSWQKPHWKRLNTYFAVSIFPSKVCRQADFEAGREKLTKMTRKTGFDEW